MSLIHFFAILWFHFSLGNPGILRKNQKVLKKVPKNLSVPEPHSLYKSLQPNPKSPSYRGFFASLAI